MRVERGWDFIQEECLGVFFLQKVAVQGISPAHHPQQGSGPAGAQLWAAPIAAWCGLKGSAERRGCVVLRN